MTSYITTCYDAIAIFLCIHIIHRYKIIMLKRDVPVLEKYVTQKLLNWNKIKNNST